jgi:hypothetical protein
MSNANFTSTSSTAGDTTLQIKSNTQSGFEESNELSADRTSMSCSGVKDSFGIISRSRLPDALVQQLEGDEGWKELMKRRPLPGITGGSHYDKVYPGTGASKLDRMTSEGYQRSARGDAEEHVIGMETLARSATVEAALARIKQV